MPDVAAAVNSLVAAREAAESALFFAESARPFRCELRRALPSAAAARSRARACWVGPGSAKPRRASREGIIGKPARRIHQDIGKRQQRNSGRGGGSQDATREPALPEKGAEGGGSLKD